MLGVCVACLVAYSVLCVTGQYAGRLVCILCSLIGE
jgi:hypothetical protein